MTVARAASRFMKESRISLPDNRLLAFTDIGEPGWPSVFFFHGAPMSRLHLSYLGPQFLAERVRVLSPDRPAYGGSTPQPGRILSDWPRDVAALADALGAERFVVAGHSSGGSYAVACAALLPSRVLAAIVLGGVTDMGWPGAWDGYVESERQLMRLPGEDAAIAWCVERFGADGSGFESASDFEFPEPDRALFADPDAGPAIAAAVQEAFRQGVAGYAQDMIVQGRPWPFDPGSITVPVHVVHGERDATVPPAHSRHTAEVIRTATLHLLPGHGHMTTLGALPALVSGLSRR